MRVNAAKIQVFLASILALTHTTPNLWDHTTNQIKERGIWLLLFALLSERVLASYVYFTFLYLMTPPEYYLRKKSPHIHQWAYTNRNLVYLQSSLLHLNITLPAKLAFYF